MNKQYLDMLNECLVAKDKGTEFSLRELIGEANWASIGNPATFGKSFKNAVKNNAITGIVHVGTDISKRRDIYRKE